MAATLAHELAHAVTHDACVEKPLDFYEVVAESVAYAVCSRFGLDLSLRSVDYVAGWTIRRRSASALPPFTRAPRP
jgi:antirestriction protein ArdC